jgi:hypothetical protein
MNVENPDDRAAFVGWNPQRQPLIRFLGFDGCNRSRCFACIPELMELHEAASTMVQLWRFTNRQEHGFAVLVVTRHDSAYWLHHLSPCL